MQKNEDLARLELLSKKQKAELQLARLRQSKFAAERDLLREKEQERKKRTRRLIIIGGEFVANFGLDDPDAAREFFAACRQRGMLPGGVKSQFGTDNDASASVADT